MLDGTTCKQQAAALDTEAAGAAASSRHNPRHSQQHDLPQQRSAAADWNQVVDCNRVI
jgi:hypothetical protein